MGLEFVEAAEPEIAIAKPECDKCHKELKANNQYSCQDDKTVCGDCWREYLRHVRKFFDSSLSKNG